MKVQLHSAGDASPLTALLLPHIFPICSVVAPCHRGASAPSMRHRNYEMDHLVFLCPHHPRRSSGAGSAMRNVLPLPFADSRLNRPPLTSTAHFAVARPSPEPPASPLLDC